MTLIIVHFGNEMNGSKKKRLQKVAHWCFKSFICVLTLC